MGILPIGGPAALFPVQRPSSPRGIARELGRYIRADTKGDQEAQPRTCASVVAMSVGGRSPTSGQGTCRSPCS